MSDTVNFGYDEVGKLHLPLKSLFSNRVLKIIGLNNSRNINYSFIGSTFFIGSNFFNERDVKDWMEFRNYILDENLSNLEYICKFYFDEKQKIYRTVYYDNEKTQLNIKEIILENNEYRTIYKKYDCSKDAEIESFTPGYLGAQPWEFRAISQYYSIYFNPFKNDFFKSENNCYLGLRINIKDHPIISNIVCNEMDDSTFPIDYNTSFFEISQKGYTKSFETTEYSNLIQKSTNLVEHLRFEFLLEISNFEDLINIFNLGIYSSENDKKLSQIRNLTTSKSIVYIDINNNREDQTFKEVLFETWFDTTTTKRNIITSSNGYILNISGYQFFPEKDCMTKSIGKDIQKFETMFLLSDI